MSFNSTPILEGHFQESKQIVKDFAPLYKNGGKYGAVP